MLLNSGSRRFFISRFFSLTKNSDDPIIEEDSYLTISLPFSRDGVKNPKWRDQVQNLEDATTPFTGVNGHFSDMEPFSFHVIAVHTNQPLIRDFFREGYFMLGITNPVPDPQLVAYSDANLLAQQKVLKDIIRRRSAFQGGKFIVEVNDTIRGLKHPLKALREGLRSYHSTVKTRLNKVTRVKLRNPSAPSLEIARKKILTGTWLEFQFGWLPLSSDIQSAINNLKQLSAPRALKFKASAALSDSSIIVTDFDDSGRSPGVFYDVIQRTRKTVTLYGAYKVAPPRGFDSESWAVSTRDFLPSIWEAIPYSFAVDYFTNIGNIIESWSYIPGNINWVARTRRISIDHSTSNCHIKTVFSSDPNIIELRNISSYGRSRIARTCVVRETIDQFGLIPKLAFSVPLAGSMKWLNIASLIHLRTIR